MSITIPTMQQLLEAGVHFGHQVRRGNPHMQEYIYGVREGVHIINLEESEKKLKEAAEYAQKLGSTGKVILFVGTKKQAQPIIKELATKIGAPYIDFRWVGGLLTNFAEVRKNIKKLIDLKDKQEKGELTHYTKKERLLITRKLSKFDRQWGGVVNLNDLPDAIFLSDSASEKTALLEAKRVGIPVIGISDTNADPVFIDYPIPGNDDATKSIKIMTDTVGEAYGEGLKMGAKTKKAAEEKAEADKKSLEEAPVDKAIEEEVSAAEEEVEKKAVEEAGRVV